MVEHIAKMKHNSIIGNIGHFDNEIDMAGLAKFSGIKRINIKPQVDKWSAPLTALTPPAPLYTLTRSLPHLPLIMRCVYVMCVRCVGCSLMATP